MSKKAIIVESPTKTRTLGRFLGDEYKLLATRGHIRDLPETGLAVDVEHDFAPEYQVIPRQKKTLQELKRALGDVDEVLLASDPDREGEAIAWHLTQALKLPSARRIEFNEITEQAVREALSHPREIDMHRVDAQQARRILDRLVGYEISPLLWRQMRRGGAAGLSAGRVQSVALRLIVEREREILAFVPEEYWSVAARLTPEDREQPFTAELKEKDGEKIAISSQAEAEEVCADLARQEFRVGEIEEKDVRRNPQPPFITSTLQRAASSELGFSASKTMRVAQQLYEGVEIGGETVGLITYMRTDSTRVAAVARDEALQVIRKQFGEDYVGPGARGKQAKSAQDAHECIRPTSVLRAPDALRATLDRDQARLYELIWRRFVASQMAPALYHQRGVNLEAGPYRLRAGSSDLVFPGYLRVLPEKEKQSEELPPLTVGELCTLLELLPEQHFTQPPPRYNEASLVQTLEEKGIGRPSTYAPIIETLRQRRYVETQKRQFLPTRLGFAVCDYLLDHFSEIMDVDFTARLEESLDTVESGEQDWKALLRDFYARLSENLEQIRERGPEALPEEACPQCGGKLFVKYSAFGKFAGCENYPDCDFTRDLSGLPEAERAEPEPLEEPCPECGEALFKRTGRRGPFIGCSAYPKCKYTRDLEPEPPAEGEEAPGEGEACPECGAPLSQRRGRFGPFLGCSAYPECRYIKNGRGGRRKKPAPVTTDLPCPDCEKPLVLRSGRRGPFLGCSGFPKCRFTREATPEELERFGAPPEAPAAESEDEAP